MGTDRATLDAYLGVEIPLPDGRVATCKALGLKRGAYWSKIRALTRITPENDREERLRASAQLAVMEDFPAEIAPEDDPDAFEVLMPAETYELLDRFLAHQRPAVIEAMNPGATARKTRETASTSGSTT